MAKILRPFTFIKVRTTSDTRYRHTMLTTVTDQDTVVGRIGTANKVTDSLGVAVNAARQSSTTTRATEFRQS